MPAPRLGAVAVRAAVERAGLEPGNVDEVIMGNVLSAGVGQAPARQVALRAGLPPSVAAVTVNKVCGSGLKAIMLAAQAIRCGDAQVIVAGGMESMSQSGFLLPRGELRPGDRALRDSMVHDGLTCPFSERTMGQIAEQLAQQERISRLEQDAYALTSHQRAVQSIKRGHADDQMVPVRLVGASGACTVHSDEGPREEICLEMLSALPPAFKAGGTVTAGNASMLSDGAAACVIASQAFADTHGREPLAQIVASAAAGTAPEDLFLAPVPAIHKVLERCGMTKAHIDLYEINEAFAVQMLACQRRLNLPPEKVNVHGGAIALGHPIGASGARVATTLVHALGQQGAGVGLAALCLGGGNAVATVFRKEMAY